MAKLYSFLLLLTLVLASGFCWAKKVPVPPPANDSAHFYTAPDRVKIYYEVHGTGYPIVLIHGFLSNAAGWTKTPLYGSLLSAGYQVILVDLRGNGKSDKPKDCNAYANDAEAKDVMGIITALDIHRYTAIGYSRGSIITARLMVLDERIDQAVMGGMGMGFTDPNWPRRIMFYKALDGQSAPPEMDAVVENAKNTGTSLKVFACQQKEQPSTSQDDLKKLRTRVLLVCGNQDVDNGDAKDLAKLLVLSTYTLVPGDHGAAVKTPEFAKAVLDWMKAQ